MSQSLRNFQDKLNKNIEQLNDCKIWTAGKNVWLPEHIACVTPRRAAYYAKHGKLPDREITLKCLTPGCVNPSHFKLGREVGSGSKKSDQRLSEAEKAQIAILAKTKTLTEIAEFYKVSLGTIARYASKKKKKKKAQ